MGASGAPKCHKINRQRLAVRGAIDWNRGSRVLVALLRLQLGWKQRTPERSFFINFVLDPKNSSRKSN
jgi:hypothetical protein